MTADAANRLVEFARACKAATRVVSMYPASHPNIQAALARMVAAGTAATDGGAFVLTVLPATILVEGRALPKPDTSVEELAALLHQHHIGELRLLAPLTGGGWHLFLSLLGMQPEELRAGGGITEAWQGAGGGPIEIREIDYAEVLRERDGPADIDATWVTLIASCLAGDERGELDERTLAALLDIARNSDRLLEFVNRLLERGRVAGHSAESRQQAVLRLLRSVATFAAEHAPDEFDAVMDNIVSGTTELDPATMLTLLGAPPVGNGVNLGGELRARYGEERLGAFVAENVTRDRGATSRLAEAFHALAPLEDTRQVALSLAEERVGMSPLGDDPAFNDIWSRTVEMLLSYSDRDYVDDAYDQELSQARTLAVEIEQINDDPPDRIAAWLATVTDSDLRQLDQQMLVDLLRLEDRPDAWKSVLELAIGRLEQLILVGELPLAGELVRAVATVARDTRSPFHADARAALDGLTGTGLVKTLMTFMRQATDEDVPMLSAFCLDIGPRILVPLTGALAAEESRLAVRRVKDIMIGFGAEAREPARTLRTSSNPAVRRLAIEVLRAVSGAGALAELRALLADTDTNVQREALRAIVQIGSDEAFRTLEDVLKAGAPREREAVMAMLGSLNDERAAPLLIHILTGTSHRGAGEALYTSAIDALGRSGPNPRSVDTLKSILYRGEWWAPGRTSRLRAAAARALRVLDTPAADAVLQEASQGPRGVRDAAALALTLPRRSRPPGGAV